MEQKNVEVVNCLKVTRGKNGWCGCNISQKKLTHF